MTLNCLFVDTEEAGPSLLGLHQDHQGLHHQVLRLRGRQVLV